MKWPTIVLGLGVFLAIAPGHAAAQGVADLAVTVTVDDATPLEAEIVNIFVTVSNDGPDAATVVEVDVPLPAEFDYLADTPTQGSYDPVTGVWDIGALAPSGVATLGIEVRVFLGAAGARIPVSAALSNVVQVDPFPGDESDNLLVAVQRGPMRLARGSYVGNGVGHTISSLEFTPEFVLVRGVHPEFGVVATSTMPAGLSKWIGDANTLQTDGVTALLADGFTTGSAIEVSDNGIEFHWIAVGAGTEVAVGSYVGDETNGRLISGLGMEPDYVVVFPEIGEASMQRFASQPAGESHEFKAGGVKTSRLLSFETGGFRIGNHNSVNKDTENYHYVAFDAALGNLRVGSYVGDGSTGRPIDSVAFPPESLLLRTEGAESADLFRTDTMSGALSLPLDNKDPVLTGIKAFTPSGFVVDDDDGSNRSGKTFHYAALREGIQPVDLQVRVSADRLDPDEGETFQLLVEVENQITEDATGVQILAALPAALLFGGATPSTGTYDDGTGVWDLGTVAGGAVATLAIDVAPGPGTAGQALRQNASLEAVDQFDADPTDDTDFVDLRVRSSDLSLTLGVSNPGPNEGDLLQLSVTASNLGPDDTDQSEVEITLPVGLTYLSALPGSGSYDEVLGIWSAGTVETDSVTTLVINVQVDGGTSGSVLPVSVGLLSSLPVDPNGANDGDSVDVTVQAADLGLKIIVDDPTPNELDTIRFTIVLDNYGPHDATGVIVNDLLPAGLTHVADTPSLGGYNPGSGNWSVGNLAAFSSATLLIDASVDAGTAGSTLTNSVSMVSVDQADPQPANDSDSVGVGVAGADIALSLSADDVAPGELQAVTLTLVATNLGPNASTGLIVTNTLPSGLTYVGHTTSQGGFDSGTGTWTVGPLGNGAAATLDVDVTVDAGTAGTVLTDSATVSARDQADPIAANDTVTVDLAVAGADVGLILIVDDLAPDVGDTIQAQVTAQNGGPGDATNLVVLVSVPAGLSQVADSVSSGSYDGGTSRWTLPTLTASSLDTLTLQLRVDADAVGATLPLAAEIDAVDQADPVVANDSVAANLRVKSADLSVRVDVDDITPNPGQGLRFEVRMSNAGPDSSGSCEVLALLPPSLGLLASGADRGSYDEPSGIWSVSDVGPGETVLLTLDAIVTPEFTGTTVTVPASILSSQRGDPAGANDSDGVTLTVQFSDIAVDLSVDDSTPEESQIIRVLIDVENRGPHRGEGLTVGVPLPAELDYETHVLSTGGYDPSTGVWSIGSLDPDSVATLHIDAQVEAGTAGSEIVVAASVADLLTGDAVAGNDEADAAVLVATTFSVQVTTEQTSAVLRKGGSSAEVLRIVLDNTGSTNEVLQSLLIHDASLGLGSTADLDSSWTPLILRESISGTALGTSEMSAGAALFSALSVGLPRGARVELAVEAGATLRARDGDLLDLELSSSADLSLLSGGAPSGSWPSNPADRFTVDGMVAERILVDSLDRPGLLVGSTRELVLSFVVPSNGYDPDVLEKVNLFNLGTAEASVDLTTVEAWADDGDGSFSASLDVGLGSFSFTGDRWELTGLEVPVGLAGQRIFVTCDVAETATVGRGIRLSIPRFPEEGLGLGSDNDGPIDSSVQDDALHVISAADRILLTTHAVDPADVRPGSSDVVLLRLQVANTYESDQSMSSMTVTNSSTGTGSQLELDAQIVSLTLREDTNGNGVVDDLATDRLLASASFSAGRATFGGLGWNVPAGEVREAFVVAKVSGSLAADGDVLAAQVDVPSDVVFASPVSVSASWPLDSGARWTVDGMLRRQIASRPTPVATLGPGEGPALALDVVVPRNGYRGDTLRGLNVENLETADETDVTELRLWRDGGDGEFDAGANDDVDLGPMAWVGSVWQSPLLDDAIPATGARLFVGATVAAAPRDARTLRLSIPVDGVSVASGNDGPIDVSVDNDASLLFSSAPLLSTIQISPTTSTLGGSVSVQMRVRNVGDETILGVVPEAFVSAGSGALTPVAGPTPTAVDLAVGAVDTFSWEFSAASIGEVRLQAGVAGIGSPSGIPRLSLPSASNTHRIFEEADSLGLFAVEAAPSTVNRGQTDVVPLTLTFEHLSGEESSDILVSSLRLRLEDAAGTGIVPDQLFSRIIVGEGGLVYADKSILESTGDTVNLVFVVPLQISSSEPASIAIQTQILPTTLQPSFRVVLDDATAIGATDQGSGAPVEINLIGDLYPLRSGLASILEEATDLTVAAADTTSLRVGRGASGATLLSLELQNPGIDGLTADVRLQAFAFSLETDGGAVVADPSTWLSRLKIQGSSLTYLERSLSPATDDTVIVVELSPPATIPVNASVTMSVEADVSEGAVLGNYRFRLGAPATVSAVDANTRQPVAVTFSPDPILGRPFRIEAAVDSAVVASAPLLPSLLNVGAVDVAALEVDVSHPGSLDAGRLRCDQITLRVTDEARRGVAPASFLSRLRLLWDDAVIADLSSLPATGDRVTVDLGGPRLEPGANGRLEVRIDVSASAPEGYFEVSFEGDDLRCFDANSGDPVSIGAADATSLPGSSGLTRVAAPASQLLAELEDEMPVMVAPGADEVPLARLWLENPAEEDAGLIEVSGVRLIAWTPDGEAVSMGRAVRRLSVWREGSWLAQSDSLGSDTLDAAWSFDPPLTVSPAESVELEIRMHLQTAPTLPRFRLVLMDDGVTVVQPPGAAFSIRVDPRSSSFPFSTQAVSVSSTDLTESYANFPNPFAAGVEPTRFSYFLASDAKVTLRIFSLRGERVRTVVDGDARPSGVQQVDTWDGRNGSGDVVRNGVYLAQLRVEYVDGRNDEVIRKVAVVR